MPAIVHRSAGYDLLQSFSALIGRQARGEWGEWVRDTADGLSVGQLRLWRRYRFAAAYVALLPTLPESHSIGAFLQAISTMPLGDFLRVAVTADYAAPDTPLSSDNLLALTADRSRARAFVDRYLRMTSHHRASVLAFLAAPEAARADLVEVLQQFATGPYAGLEGQLRAERERAAVGLSRVVTDLPATWPAWLPPYGDLTGFSPVVLAPSGFLGTGISVYYHEIRQPLFDGTDYEPFIITVGAQRASGPIPLRPGGVPVPDGASDAERYSSVHATLGDPTRLRLVHLLAQRPWYGQELAAELRMSAASISHHVSILVRAGLLGVERRSHRTYYVLKKESLRDSLNLSRQYLLGDGGSDEREREGTAC